MKLWTSNYARNAKHPKAVAISIKPIFYYKGRNYFPLAPTWDIVMGIKQGLINQQQYTEQYLELLQQRNLNPIDVANELGDGAVMLCYESPTDFCHRHIVADWMKQAGIEVEELLEKTPKDKQVEQLLIFK